MINGVENDPYKNPCEWVAVDPRACVDCVLNPDNKPDEAVAPPTALYCHIQYLQNLEAIGVRFSLDDLTPLEASALMLLRQEQYRKLDEKK